jgi:hypothetical protein
MTPEGADRAGLLLSVAALVAASGIFIGALLVGIAQLA